MVVVNSLEKYPLVWRDQPTNSVRFALSDEAKKATRVVYGFFDQSGACLGVGETSTSLSRRMSNYHSKIKDILNEDSIRPSAMLVQLSKRVGTAYLAILEHVPQEKSPRDAEKEWIDRLKPRFNSNRGGGGGTSVCSPSRRVRHSPYTAENFDAAALTPDKNYAFRTNPQTQRPLLDLTPTGRSQRRCVYRYRVEAEDGDVLQYIGMTGRHFSTRMYEHSRLTSLLQDAVSKHLFADAGVIYECDENEDPGIAERLLIEAAAEKQVRLINQRAGGGGGRTT